jgi:hypothetical protein
MNTGLRIRNQHTTVQVDQSYFNLALVEKRQISFSGQTGEIFRYNFYWATGTAMVGSDNSILGCSAVKKAFVNGVYEYALEFRTTGPTNIPVSETFNLYIFDIGMVYPTINVGLRVWNDDRSKLIYHSGMKVLNFVDVLPCSQAFVGEFNRKYIPIFLEPSNVVAGVAPPVRYTYLLKSFTTYIQIYYVEIGSYIYPMSDVGTYAAVDVTGY